MYLIFVVWKCNYSLYDHSFIYNENVFVPVAGGVLLALIEGVGILITRWSADQYQMGRLHFIIISKTWH